jgi:hypothetical protein
MTTDPEAELLDRFIADHLILYGDPDAPPNPHAQQLADMLCGDAPRPEPTMRFCSWGSGCPIHPEGKGGPWMV